MDWQANDIHDRSTTWYKHDTLGRRMTGYSLFMGVSCSAYRDLCNSAQMDLRETITRRYTTKVTLNEMAWLVWRNMSHESKHAWKDCAILLNSRYVTGQFNSLPTCVHEDFDKFLRDCFREEAMFLKKCFKMHYCRRVSRILTIS